jgi:AhpD family alkylhydroperoxidase
LNLHVSELNGCGYCISAHEAFSKHAGLSLADIERARLGQGANAREDALLALARRVVRAGGARTGGEVARCREAEVADATIIDVLAIVALKTFTNAVALVAQTQIDFPKAPRIPQD